VLAAAELRGIPPPADLIPEEPEQYDGDDFYIAAFWALSTTRQVGFGRGCIPWNHIVEYAKVMELDEELTPMFVEVIREMDVGYLAFHAKKDKEAEDARKT
jgi:hypothetical protein